MLTKFQSLENVSKASYRSWKSAETFRSYWFSNVFLPPKVIHNRDRGWLNNSLSIYGHIYRLDIFNRSSWHGIHHSFCNKSQVPVVHRPPPFFSHVARMKNRTVFSFGLFHLKIPLQISKSVFEVIMSRSLNVPCKYHC